MRAFRLLLLFACCYPALISAQITLKPSQADVVRCYTMEADEARRAANPELGSLEDLERWLAPRVAVYQETAAGQRAVITIPIVFHIIHNNGADNLNASYVNAQIAQRNEGLRSLGAGFNNHPDGADSEIEFCPATVDPNGNPLAEPGIHRVYRLSAGFTAPPYSTSYYESTIKPATIWDPTKYCNVWVSDLSGGLLGYAQFPEAASLPGIGTGNGGANTDGVVVLYSSVGSIANPHPSGGVYAAGRTLTHELGHWLGLRHIWGDGNCNADDYCDDTPRASSATSGCPVKNTCNDMSYGTSTNPNDMVENYMDYSYDNCMNIFTQDQKARMQVVLASSPRRASLVTSTACGGGSADTQAPTTPGNLSAQNIATTTASLSWSASSDNVGVTGYDVYVNGNLLGNTPGTSANLSGLSPGTTYNASVRARDAAGNQSGAATTSFTTLTDGGSECVDGEVTVTIRLDNYPEETSWSITSGGSTVASGGPYGNRPDGSTVSQTVSLSAGNYTFTIFDAYGDGLCCGYGQGSYLVTSGTTIIADGAAFGSSESTDFCVEGSATDTQAPSVPGQIAVSAITHSTATVSWSASSDNVGVTGYNVYIDGHLVGSVINTFVNLSGLDASTTYVVEVTAFDEAGNESAPAQVSFTTAAPPDTQAPTAPTNVAAVNITQNSAELTWTASQDLVGVVSYNVSVNGNLTANVPGTSANLSGLTANTTYSVAVTALDAAGNESAPGTTSFTTLPSSGGPSTDLIFGHYFEQGWDGWTDGGSDCGRYRGGRSWEGRYSIQLRDNSGTASAMTLNNVDVSGYDELELKFYFYAYSMENGEDFWVRVNDGSGWQTIAAYARGADFNNNTFYSATITLSSASFNFNPGFDIRIQCDASDNNDQVYIDEITLTGTTNVRNSRPGVSHYLEAMENRPAPEADAAEAALIESLTGELLIYPNPASDRITVIDGIGAEVIRVFSLTGVQVAEITGTGEDAYRIDLSGLDAGAYIIQLQRPGKVATGKFVKY